MREETLKRIIAAIKKIGSYSRSATVENVAFTANCSDSTVRKALKLGLIGERKCTVFGWESKTRGQAKGRTYEKTILGIKE